MRRPRNNSFTVAIIGLSSMVISIASAIGLHGPFKAQPGAVSASFFSLAVFCLFLRSAKGRVLHRYDGGSLAAGAALGLAFVVAKGPWLLPCVLMVSALLLLLTPKEWMRVARDWDFRKEYKAEIQRWIASRW